jgi:glycine/D-amino acid oxidase-like deaminating enzyme
MTATSHAFPLQPALWAATAVSPRPIQVLEGPHQTEVCVVGGGFAGLSTAMHLARQGVKVAVLETHEPGWGASGRNGGQVIPGLKYDPAEMRRVFGAERGEQLVRFAGATADAVFDLIREYRMEVPHARAGWIQGAHTPAGVDLVRSRAEQWHKEGVKGAVFLDRAATAQALGTDCYLAGWLHPGGGAVQPLSYARELARVCEELGVMIWSHTPAKALERYGSRWQVTTANGHTVSADQVVVCTNGYSGGLVPGIRESVITPNSFQVATEPLDPQVAASILPQGHVTSDTRQLLFYFRLDHQRRLLMGGRGPFREPKSDDDWAHLVRVMHTMFPQVRQVPIAFRWCGRVALTRDFMPHLHEPQPGLLVNVGCMGRGVGLQTAMGRVMAEYVRTRDVGVLPLPLTGIKGIPLHRFRKVYLSMIIAWYRMRDGGLA